MKHSFPTLVPNRIDRDPAIIRGVTAPELYLIITLAIPTGLLAIVVFGLVLQSFFAGIAFGMVALVLVLIFGVVFIAHIKRDRPNHYLTHVSYINAEKVGLLTTPFIHQSTRFKVYR